MVAWILWLRVTTAEKNLAVLGSPIPDTCFACGSEPQEERTVILVDFEDKPVTNYWSISM